MGINNSFAKFLMNQKQQGVDFSSMVTLGRMKLYANKDILQEYCQKYNISKKVEEVSFVDEYAEPFYQLLGAEKYDSMDYSDYEQATLLQDLNKPVPQKLHNQYLVVLDSGTLEHVFNFPVGIKSCMEMVKVGGHFIGVTPANNMFGHGFYQFSPELFYRIFAKENGFKVIKMTLGVFNSEGDVEKWYDVKDPVEVNSRVMMINNKESFLFIVAQKLENVEIFKTSPYQSDYAATWESKVEADQGADHISLKSVYRSIMPKSAKTIVQKVRAVFNKPKYQDEYIGTINPGHFKEVEI